VTDEWKPAKPGARDKCPVCGMFVSKYPDWTTSLQFQDGSTAFFDGTKDMFKCYFNLAKYRPGQQTRSIQAIYVTDYYSLSPIDGTKAYYVAGSDVYGPMGKELIAFVNEAEARQFMKDHHGKSWLRFPDINQAILKGLE
jgi:copper chaperone NosL